MVSVVLNRTAVFNDWRVTDDSVVIIRVKLGCLTFDGNKLLLFAT